MRVLPTQQIYRPAAFEARAERRTRVADAAEGSAVADPAPAPEGPPPGRALVAVGELRMHGFAGLCGAAASAAWVAQALGQMRPADDAARPATAAAAYELADSMSGHIVVPAYEGARFCV